MRHSIVSVESQCHTNLIAIYMVIFDRSQKVFNLCSILAMSLLAYFIYAFISKIFSFYNTRVSACNHLLGHSLAAASNHFLVSIWQRSEGDQPA